MPAKPVIARDIMVSRLITLRPDMDVFAAIDLLLKHNISGAPVVDQDGRYLGVFSESCSISLLLAAAYDGAPTNEIERFVDGDAPTIEPGADLLTIAQVFLETRYRRLPVLEDGRLLGQVSRRDLLKAARQLLEMGSSEGSSVLYLSGLVDAHDSSILVLSRV
ncbi:MAG: CBS domain-containing protein [Planctomycetaceae bacterium]|jgi:CBS domain-containing protein